VEEGAGADDLRLLREGEAALGDRLVEVLDGVEVSVGKRFVDEGPQMLGWLQLGTVRRLEGEPDAVWHGEVFRPVPASVVELQHDALVGPAPADLAKSASTSSK
jgi:hypothetical protein